MAYETESDRYCARIDAAKRAVAKAMTAYSRNGDVDAVNKANRDLADADAAYNEWSGGLVPDDRR